MRVFICEKHDLAKSVFTALSGKAPDPAYKGLSYQNGSDVVIWVRGHLLGLSKPEAYDGAFADWEASFKLLPFVPNHWKKEMTNASVKSLYENVQSWLKKTDEVVHVGDADREGQLLIDELLEDLQYTGPVKRLLVHDTNAPAIRKSIENMKDNSVYVNLKRAAEGRERADYLIGMNMSRVYMILSRAAGHKGVVSVGRVQTPTLGLVVRRDREIEGFVPKPYWTLEATFKTQNDETYKGFWSPKEEQTGLDENNRLIDENVADYLLATLKGANDGGKVVSVETKNKKSGAPMPHKTPTLLVECNKVFDLPVNKTTEILQALYDEGITTYPRSDCEYLPLSEFEKAPQVLETVAKIYPDLASDIEKADFTKKTAAWNDSKVEEHFAIIPTGKEVKLTGDRLNVYTLIVKRYLAQFLADYQYLSTEIQTDVSGEIFKSRGIQVQELGWKALYKSQPEETDDEKETEQTLPDLVKDETVVVSEVKKNAKKTTPPKRFTQATLIEAMNSIYKFVDDPEIKKTLKEVSGIGQSATQAQIVTKLLDRGFLVQEKKALVSTKIGRALIDSVSKECSTPDYTALMEQDLKRVAEGEMTLEAFMEETTNLVKKLVEEGKKTEIKGDVSDSAEKCPYCGGALRFFPNAKSGPVWKCLSPDCGRWIADVKGKPDNPPKCPQCGALMERKNKKAGGFFYACKCGFTLYTDEKGKVEKTATCPHCKTGILKRFKSLDGTRYYWWCLNKECQKFVDDVNGKPLVKAVKCPKCKSDLKHILRKDGTYCWKCESCNTWFDDEKGKPVEQKKKQKGN